ncbi:hypothetical protein ABB37_02497 [Leptomonas pyrrhocoris]|uniref:Uncharacterized protein n=1 Tax=Leptomonas pyrrhocoris TaxID=157538 RepID=A0A0M9G5M6_LEPPY|nr:hypothetical protein ABB37_02497 [Leptomonas pyrrhocoris]KPA82666.1 hypothetical protein ABB37_02497 [Leptomonas pyrrhocoris]|eukprot:XP_015661105.1 hypothetical protein ABB37_02497 [Leptomonas pyrrhocoris]
MTSSSAPLAYPSSGECNVLIQRFKLLNLVQRVAHRDVSEMIDTVGLESLVRKGTLAKWAWTAGDDWNNDDGAFGDRGTEASYAGYGKYTARRRAERQRHRANTENAAATRSVSQRTTSPPGPARMAFGRSTTGFEARVAAARWNSGVEEDNEEESRKYGLTRRVDVAAPRTTSDGREESATRRRYVVRRTQRLLRSSPADRDAFFSRLAEPRERPEPVVEDVFVYDAVPDRRGRDGGSSRSKLGAREIYLSGDGQRGEQDDYYAAQNRRHAPPLSTLSLPSPPPLGFSHSSSTYVNRRGGAEGHSFDADDIRAHYQGTSSMYPPPSHALAAPGGVPSQPGEGRYRCGYSSVQVRGESEEEVEDTALPSALPPAPSLQGRQQQQLSSDTPAPLHSGGQEEAEESVEMQSTLLPTESAPAARGAVPDVKLASFADGPARRRNVNFALNKADLYDGMPTTGNDNATSMDSNAWDVPGATASADCARGPECDDATSPVLSHLHFPRAGGNAAGALNITGSVRGGGGSSLSSPGGLKTRSSSGVAGFPKSPRMGRGLAPKAKPKGAVVDSQIPVEAVRHAAALITRANSTPTIEPSPNTSTPGNSYVAAHASPQSQQPPMSRIRSNPVGFAHGGSILLSPRPRTVEVSADSRQQHMDGGQHSPEAPVGSAVSAPITPRFSTRTGAAVAEAAAAPAGVSTAAGASTAVPVNEGAQQSFQAVSSKVDHMLQNLQRMLRRVYKDGGDEVPDKLVEADPKTQQRTTRGGGVGARTPSEDDAYSSSFEESDSEKDTTGAGNDSYNIYREEDGLGVDGEDDEMLLYTQIQHKVSRLGAAMSRLTLPSSSEDGEGSVAREAAAAAAAVAFRQAERSSTAPAAPPSSSALSPGRSPGSRPAAARRARGDIPDGIVQRLCAYRMEHFQYIAYNERLWNTSTTSQFVFAQRLTAALLEECWAEVMAEVDANMSEYVEGLVDHELQ